MNRRNFFGIAGAAVVAGLAGQASAEGMKPIAQGSFEGRSNHVTSGTVRIVEMNDQYFVELGDDFSLDGGPDPRVGFGRGGEYLGHEGYLGALQNLNGKQVYAIPRVWRVDSYDEVFIWCEVAGVPLGVASLK